MGDTNASGVASYAKFAEAEYETAINAAVELVRENYLLPLTGAITWVGDQYNYAPPTSMIAMHTVRARRGADNLSVSTSRTPEVYEVVYPMDWISVQYTRANVLQIHFDEESIKARGYNVADLELLVEGYQYQDALSAGADNLYINWAVILLLAKAWMHLTGSNRDWNDMMKHLRQWQATVQEANAYASEDFEMPGTLWLTQ
jgi:hypothetical protein